MARRGGGRQFPAFETEIKDDRLRLMFVCCHPLISREDQVALALKRCAVSARRKSRRRFSPLRRPSPSGWCGKKKIREAGIRFEIPKVTNSRGGLMRCCSRLSLVQQKATKPPGGEALIREDLFAGSHPPDATAGGTSRRQSTENPRVAGVDVAECGRIPRARIMATCCDCRRRIVRASSINDRAGDVSSGALGGRRNSASIICKRASRRVTARRTTTPRRRIQRVIRFHDRPEFDDSPRRGVELARWP